jgi:polar amino acid transport system substrate-binding protein
MADLTSGPGRRVRRLGLTSAASMGALALAALGLWHTGPAGEVAAAPAANPFEGRGDVVEHGRSLFNQYCSHCHGPNAIQGERVRDLRRLTIRYGAEASQVFIQTVSVGRPDKGMPVWKGVLTEEVLWRIYTYLQTVQTKP